MITFRRSDIIATYGATLAVMLSSLGVMFVANNFLGVDQYGNFIFYLSIAGLLTSLFSVRSGESVIRLLASGQISRPHLQAAAFITDLLLASVILVLVVPFCLLLFQLFDIDVYGNAEGEMFLFLAASFVMPILSGVVMGSLLFDEHFQILGFLRVISPLFRLAVLPLLVSNGFDVGSLAKIYLLSTVVSCVFAWLVFLFIYGPLKLSFSLNDLTVYWAEVKKIYLSLFFKSTIANSDSIILGLVAGSEKVGVLSTIKLLLQPINFVFNPLGRIIFPRVAKSIKIGDRENVMISIRNYSLAGLFSVLFILAISLSWDEFLSGFTKVSFLENLNAFVYVAIQALSLAIGDWWFRSFSLSFNPDYSVKSAFFSALYIWTICFCGSLLFGFYAFLALMSAMYIVRSLWFWSLLFRFRESG